MDLHVFCKQTPLQLAAIGTLMYLQKVSAHVSLRDSRGPKLFAIFKFPACHTTILHYDEVCRLKKSLSWIIN